MRENREGKGGEEGRVAVWGWWDGKGGGGGTGGGKVDRN